MNTVRMDQQEFDACADTALHVNSLLLAVQDALERGDVAGAQKPLAQARAANWNNEKRLVRLGAADPIDARFARIERDLPLAESIAMPLVPELPLHLLDTPASRRYAARLRDAYEALREVEAERGIHDGTSEAMAETLASVEQEVFGAVGTRGLE